MICFMVEQCSLNMLYGRPKQSYYDYSKTVQSACGFMVEQCSHRLDFSVV